LRRLPNKRKQLLLSQSLNPRQRTSPLMTRKKVLAKQKRARIQTFNMYFNELSEDIQQQWIETNKPGYQHKMEKWREI
jgi:hypothetical protein